MASGIEVAASVITLVSAAQNISHLMSRWNRVEEAKGSLLSMDISILRLLRWQEQWLKGAKGEDVKLEELWGVTGSRLIVEDLLSVNDLVIKLNAAVGGTNRLAKDYMEVQGKPSLSPEIEARIDGAVKDVWKRTNKYRHLSKFFRKSVPSSVQHDIRELNCLIDELDHLAMLSYQAQHRLESSRAFVASSAFIEGVVHSRQGALNLWSYCRITNFRGAIGIDMLWSRGGSVPLHVAPHQTAQAPCFRLLWQEEKVYGLANLTNTEVWQHADLSSEESSKAKIKSHTGDLRRRKSTDREPFNVSSAFSSDPSKFRFTELKPHIDSEYIARCSASQLAADTNERKDKHIFSIPSTQEKIRLAFKLSECGVQLLGTPWFAMLTSSKIDHIFLQRDTSKMKELEAILHRAKPLVSDRKRVSSTSSDLYEHDLFTLEIPQLEIEDMIVQDSGLLAEHHQIFEFGLLLIRIAIGEDQDFNMSRANIETEETRAWAWKALPRVRQELGIEYAEACAFCVGQPRKGHWESYRCNKFAHLDLESWRDYLERFIESFYSQVYLRQALFSFQIDTVALRDDEVADAFGRLCDIARIMESEDNSERSISLGYHDKSSNVQLKSLP